MKTYSEIPSAAGAFIVAIGASMMSYNFYKMNTDALVQSTAMACLNMQQVTTYSAFYYCRIAMGFLLPRATPFAETLTTNICDTAIRLNNYSSAFFLSTSFIAAGCMVFALSKCFIIKLKIQAHQT